MDTQVEKPFRDASTSTEASWDQIGKESSDSEASSIPRITDTGQDLGLPHSIVFSQNTPARSPDREKGVLAAEACEPSQQIDAPLQLEVVREDEPLEPLGNQEQLEQNPAQDYSESGQEPLAASENGKVKSLWTLDHSPLAILDDLSPSLRQIFPRHLLIHGH